MAQGAWQGRGRAQGKRDDGPRDHTDHTVPRVRRAGGSLRDVSHLRSGLEGRVQGCLLSRFHDVHWTRKHNMRSLVAVVTRVVLQLRAGHCAGIVGVLYAVAEAAVCCGRDPCTPYVGSEADAVREWDVHGIPCMESAMRSLGVAVAFLCCSDT